MNSTEALPVARVLALTRITAGVVIATSAEVHRAVEFAAVDVSLLSAPAGLGWLLRLQLPSTVVAVLVWATVCCAVLGALGTHARAAFAVASCTLSVLLALPQRIGAVTHAHHLLWIALLLALSPCSDVWSVDRHFEPRALAPRTRYLAPLVWARTLFATVYFFPGLHKLLNFLHGTEPGAWLRSHLAWKWLQHGHAPDLPFALTPASTSWLALAAVAFELSTPLLVLFRVTRPIAFLGALAFQLGTATLLFIRFDSLVVLLVPLIDLGKFGGRTELRAVFPGDPLTWLGAALTLGMLVTGLMARTQFYPVACYPTFADPAPATMPSARVWLRDGDVTCPLPPPRSNAEWIQAFRIVGAYGDQASSLRAQSYMRSRLRQRLRATRCRIMRATVLELHHEVLAWDFAAARSRVLQDHTLYTLSATALGVAPADGDSASSSPAR